MKNLLVLFVLFVAYGLIIVPLSQYQQEKLYIEKVGYVPSPTVLRLFSGDQTLFIGTWLIGKSVSYYGGLYQEIENRFEEVPDLAGMYRILKTGLNLDPYNMDGYYFAQATLVWDMKQVKEANSLLVEGMKYRDWDFYLPFFLGFNNAYFLRDFAQAAKYYQRVAELTGGDLSMRLTGRYLYESGRVDLAINYLSGMVKGARNKAVKRSLQTRLNAFIVVRTIERAYLSFIDQNPEINPDIDSLVESGFLTAPPVDPYGGEFYIDVNGKVSTTSKFSFASQSK